MISSWNRYYKATPEPLRSAPGTHWGLARVRMRTTPTMILILERASFTARGHKTLAQRMARTERSKERFGCFERRSISLILHGDSIWKQLLVRPNSWRRILQKRKFDFNLECCWLSFILWLNNRKLYSFVFVLDDFFTLKSSVKTNTTAGNNKQLANGLNEQRIVTHQLNDFVRFIADYRIQIVW